MESDFTLERYLQFAARKGTKALSYLRTHEKRYAITLEFLGDARGSAALELGSTEFFQLYLQNVLGFEETWATQFGLPPEQKLGKVEYEVGEYRAKSTSVSLELESELFPLSGEKFDLVLMCEVIEHFDVDPMFCLVELNRIMHIGGKLLITTPNACSAKMAHKCALGYRPHFFMQYTTDRSPYRHNFEHDVHSLISLTNAAGFEIEKLETHDVFQDTDHEALQFLREANMPMEWRGDDILLLAKKVGSPTDRWPADVYYHV